MRGCRYTQRWAHHHCRRCTSAEATWYELRFFRHIYILIQGLPAHSTSRYPHWIFVHWSCTWAPRWRSPHSARKLALVYVLLFPYIDLRLKSNSATGFYLNLPIGGCTFVALTIIRIPDAKVKVDSQTSTKEKVDRLDLLGCAIFAPAIIMLLLALEWGGTRYPWSSSTIIGLFCGAAATLGAFIAWESRRGNNAMMPLSLFRNSIVSCAVIANIVSNGAFFLITYYLALWFQVVKNASPLMSGVYTLPSVLSQITGTIATGFLGK